MCLISVLLSALIFNYNIRMHSVPRYFLFVLIFDNVLLVAVFVEFMNAIVFQEKATLEVLNSQCVNMLFVSLLM